MNQKIKEYWEKQGHTIHYSASEHSHYYHMSGTGPKISVAKLKEDGHFEYWNYPHWISESEMLGLI